LEENRLNPSKSSRTTFLFGVGISIKTAPEHSIADHKVMVIDGGGAITGSFNFTESAEGKNTENLLILQDKKLALFCTKDWQKPNI